MLAMTEIQQEFPSCFLTFFLKRKTHSHAFGPVRERHLSLGRWGILASLMLLLAQGESRAAGTWSSLASAPLTGVNHAMVLSDGTILTDNGSGNCCRLTPDRSEEHTS